MRKCFSAGLRVLLLVVLLRPLGVLAQEQEEFTPSGRVWGYIFGDYFYKASGDTARWGDSQYAGVQKNMHAGQLRRLYLGYDYTFSPQFTSRVLLEANDRTTFAGGSYGVLVKLGYLAWKEPIPGLPLTASIGLLPTPVFAFPERTWGYRSIEKELLDARGFGRSADQGVSVQGTFTRGGVAGYHLMVGNNSGTRPALNPYKAFYGALSNRMLDGKMSVEVMASYLPANAERSTAIGRLFVGYEPGFATFGLELAGVRDDAAPELSGTGRMSRLLTSGFVAVPFRSDNRLRGFVRYDYYNPDLDFDLGKDYLDPEAFYTEHLFIVGLEMRPATRVHLMPNLWVNAYRPRESTTPARRADVVPRLTVYFVY